MCLLFIFAPELVSSLRPPNHQSLAHLAKWIIRYYCVKLWEAHLFCITISLPMRRYESLRSLNSVVRSNNINNCQLYSSNVYHLCCSVRREKLRPLLLLEDSAAQEFCDLDKYDPNCVVVGLSPSSFHYAKLDEAFKLGKPSFWQKIPLIFISVI